MYSISWGTDVGVLGHRRETAREALALAEEHVAPGPALHSGIALVAAAVEPVPSLDHADAALASSAPFLAAAEPTLLLLAFALGAFGGTIGNGDAFDAHRVGCCLVLH